MCLVDTSPYLVFCPKSEKMFFRFYTAKVLDCIFVQGILSGWLAEKNSQSKNRKPIKIGKNIPMGLFIIIYT